MAAGPQSYLTAIGWTDALCGGRSKSRNVSNEDSGPKFSSNAFVPRPSEQFQKFLNLDNIRDAFALKMGLALLAWTSCCENVSIIFDHLTGLGEQTSEAIFKCIRSDYSQREVTLEVARIKLKGHVDILKRLEQTFRQITELSAERNIIAHDSFCLNVDNDWNAEMRPMAENHEWTTAAERRLESLAEKLSSCDHLLFEIWMAISELRSIGAFEESEGGTRR
jgi:hypothetical protein